MEIKKLLTTLGERVHQLKDSISTEEATKTAFILPFIQALGYDIFNPLEVVPEYIADVGSKKGEKIDYAIFRDGKPAIIIECKNWQEQLHTHNEQLYRYFAMLDVKFAILTNGIKYMFFTDLETPNKMDKKPFFEFDITLLNDIIIDEIKKFNKVNFDIEAITSNASELKYTKEIKAYFMREIKDPSPEFVKFFMNAAYDGIKTQKAIESFAAIVSKSLQQVINDLISERLMAAMASTSDTATPAKEMPASHSGENKIITTEEEIEAFHIIKAILRTKIPASRIAMRDKESYCGILLDDNNRKPICRLYLNSPTKKYLALFNNESRKEIKMPINSIDDIYAYAKDLETTIDMYEPKE